MDAAHSPRFSRMAHVYCHMFANAPPTFKDLWGSSFFEAWALTMLIALQVMGEGITVSSVGWVAYLLS